MRVLRKRRRRRIIVCLIIIVILGIGTIFFMRVRPAFMAISGAKIRVQAHNIINDVIEERLNSLNYQNLLTYEKDENGQITLVNSNIVLMNKLANEISTEIINKIHGLEYIYIDMPIGSLSESGLLTASGPMIRTKFIPDAEVQTEFKTDFSSTGINQTKHKIFLNIDCNVMVLSAFINNNININLQIPIIETVIVGGVPETYYEFEGITDEDTLNTVN